MVRELPVLVVIALGLALLIKTFLVQAFYIPSDSMQNTLQIGDRVLVNKLSTRFGDVKRGQVVVFRDPGGWLPEALPKQPPNRVLGAVKDVLVFIGLLPSDSEKDLIKRVIGEPGDHVVCCDKKSRISINGVPLDEPYVFPGDPPADRPFDVTVPAGRLWVMGDHRALSADSRVHTSDPGGGSVPERNVIGRAVVVAWPYHRWQAIPVPATFDQAARHAAATAVAAAAVAPAGFAVAAAAIAPAGLAVAPTGLAVAPTLLGVASPGPLVLWRRRRRELPRRH